VHLLVLFILICYHARSCEHKIYQTNRLLLLHTIAQHCCSHSRNFKHSLCCPVYLGTGIVFVG